MVEEQLLMVPQTRKAKNTANNLMIDLTGKRAEDASSYRSSVLQSQLSNYMAVRVPGQKRSKSKPKKKKKSQSPTLRSNSSMSFSDSRSLQRSQLSARVLPQHEPLKKVPKTEKRKPKEESKMLIDLSFKQKLPSTKKLKASPKNNREGSPKPPKEVGERVTLYSHTRMKTYDQKRGSNLNPQINIASLGGDSSRGNSKERVSKSARQSSRSRSKGAAILCDQYSSYASFEASLSSSDRRPSKQRTESNQSSHRSSKAIHQHSQQQVQQQQRKETERLQ